MRWIAAALCAATLASSGCTLCRWKEDCCADIVDDISDHECHLDWLYCPALDISRIGKPDWCQCRINSFLNYPECACNLPYYGPRNRWRDAQACKYYEVAPEAQPQTAPFADEETLPPLPASPDASAGAK